jgi:ATP-binding cassette subfamily D (ALD) protein 3
MEDERERSDIAILSLLHKVRLSHVLRKLPEGLDTVMNWSTVLSGGEQQRLMFARLFYHRPCFALLDESTSAVSRETEEHLYDLCVHSFHITVVSVSHRQALQRFHKVRETESTFNQSNMHDSSLS